MNSSGLEREKKIKDRAVRDIKKLFEHKDEDYCKLEHYHLKIILIKLDHT